MDHPLHKRILSWSILIAVAVGSGVAGGFLAVRLKSSPLRAESFELIDRNGILRARLSLIERPNIQDHVPDLANPFEQFHGPNLSFFDAEGHVRAELGLLAGQRPYLHFSDWVAVKGQGRLRKPLVQLESNGTDSALYLYQPRLEHPEQPSGYGAKLIADNDGSVLHLFSEAPGGLSLWTDRSGTSTMLLDEAKNGALILGTVKENGPGFKTPQVPPRSLIHGLHLAKFDGTGELTWATP